MSAPHTISRQSSLLYWISRLFRLVFVAVLLVACSAENPGTTVSPDSANKTAVLQAEVTFDAQTPTKLADNQNLYVEFLDEVTGLALNATRVKMSSQDHLKYTAKVPFLMGSVVKYRYVRDNDPVGTEYTSTGQQVRYRLAVISAPTSIRDFITAWKSEPAKPEQLGRIQGQVANKVNNAPIVNAYVTAGGVHTLTSSDGSYILEGLPIGTHNLVVYSMDGSFRAFQQGAVVAPGSTTPALVMVETNKMVKVTFLVRPPADHVKGIPVRLVGNIYPLGNTFADLEGGVSVAASRAPTLTMLADGRYSISMQLPIGLDLRYKYTLGDGFWNAERSADGNTRLRQVIVAGTNMTLEDTVDTWTTKGFGPVSFTVTVPPGTPGNETVTIQFNPYGWTQPIPMWKTGQNQWSYVLYGPLNLFKTATYRYCRNGLCNIADASETRGQAAKGKSFSPTANAQTFQDTLTGWAWNDGVSDPVVVSATINQRAEGFSTGVELMPGYAPAWQPYMPLAVQNVKDLGSNTIMFTPSWHLTYKNPPVMAPVAGQDPLWFDLSQMANQAHDKKLDIIYHPVLRYPEAADAWWQSAPRDGGWWQSWFDRYQTFILYHADLATQTGAKALVIGDETLLPAWPNGTLADGSASNVPGDAEQRWAKLIEAVRARYTGKLAWLVPYSGTMPEMPAFSGTLDMLYVQMTPPLISSVSSDQLSLPELQSSVANVLDADILTIQEKTGQPVMLGLLYPSVKGALDDCIDSNGACLTTRAFEQAVPEYPGVELDLKAQADAYSALLTAVNDRSWISGFFASGYYPPAALKDLSVSVHGKPAADILWYWYPRMTGAANP